MISTAAFAALLLASQSAPQAEKPAEKPAQKPTAAEPPFPPPGDATPQKPEFPPKRYDCRFTETPPTLDGKLDDGVWTLAEWTDEFGDIQGPKLPKPRYATRVKMLWDSTYFYIAARMEEPHVWAKLTKHDEIVFHDNDFEVFIDPDGDTREYYELEVNALETIFDLYLHRRYKEDGPAEHAWNAVGLRTKVAVQGTINDPTDRDAGWTLEWAIPWSAFVPPAWERPSFTEKARGAAVPKPGEEWRVNFSRVQWLHNWEGKTAPKPYNGPIDNRFDQPPPPPGAGDGKPTYEKTAGKPEDNWTWTPQWQIDMHDPRWWGRVKFVK